jgi:hypothetical protein
MLKKTCSILIGSAFLLALTACNNSYPTYLDKKFFKRETSFFDSLRNVYLVDTILVTDKIIDYKKELNNRVFYSRSISMYTSLQRYELDVSGAKQIGERYFIDVMKKDSNHYFSVDVNYITPLRSRPVEALYFPSDYYSQTK